jgi:DNA invertase Pin-like site-specific DNA recombinase
MVIAQLKKLEAVRARLQAKLDRELAALPAKYGFETAEAFVKAVSAASASGSVGGRARGRPRGAAKAAAPARKRRKRAKITDEMRAQVKALVEAGKTGGLIAKELDISLPSVQNIKKALGLVKAR